MTTPLGTYDIPVAPQRVIAVDSRLDLEPAVALGLPLIGYTTAGPGRGFRSNPTVPISVRSRTSRRSSGSTRISSSAATPAPTGGPPTGCREIAPVLTTDFGVDWRENFAGLATWLGATDLLAKVNAEYTALIEEIATR
ncbi:ABC transporter substrate-binding protein, partial [Rhodococcus hoagii]|nr:ABC transporter substrate-binding protein [Prescottella equi]